MPMICNQNLVIWNESQTYQGIENLFHIYLKDFHVIGLKLSEPFQVVRQQVCDDQI